MDPMYEYPNDEDDDNWNPNIMPWWVVMSFMGIGVASVVLLAAIEAIRQWLCCSNQGGYDA